MIPPSRLALEIQRRRGAGDKSTLVQGEDSLLCEADDLAGSKSRQTKINSNSGERYHTRARDITRGCRPTQSH